MTARRIGHKVVPALGQRPKSAEHHTSGRRSQNRILLSTGTLPLSALPPKADIGRELSLCAYSGCEQTQQGRLFDHLVRGGVALEVYD